jgi:peptidoglycan/LPS O-acetylase OafA/YrhL
MKEQNKTERLEILDLMRFVAAMSVMIYHFTFHPAYLGHNTVDEFAPLQSFSKYGYLGVELFFLISGFVIFWSASGRALSAYAASRISRLIPSLWAAVALTSVVLVLSGRGAGIVESKVLAANLALVAGPLGLPYVDGVYWTLQYEVKFYVLAWLVMWAGKRVRLEFWLGLWLLGLALSHAALAPKLLKGMVLFPYGSYFVAGSLFYLIWLDGVTRLRVGLLTAALVLSLLCLRSEAPGFMNNDGSVCALLIACTVVFFQFLLFFAIALRAITLPLSTWWLWLGSLTYPLYLLHAQIGRILASLSAPLVGDTMAMLLAMAVSFGLAVVFARTTETHGCSWLRRALLNGFSSLKWRTGPTGSPP